MSSERVEELISRIQKGFGLLPEHELADHEDALRELAALAERGDEYVDALEDISTDAWKRYPNRAMHGCDSVQSFARHTLALAPTPERSDGGKAG